MKLNVNAVYEFEPECGVSTGDQHQAALIEEGQSLARKYLGLTRDDVPGWGIQYAEACQQAVAAWIPGDGKSFRQAFVFPLATRPQADSVTPLVGQMLHVCVELPEGALCYLRLLDLKGSIRLGEFMAGIRRCFSRSVHATTRLAELERCISLSFARRVKCENFNLEDHELVELAPAAIAAYSDRIFNGFGPLPHLGRKEARKKLVLRLAGQFDHAFALFKDNLNQDVFRVISNAGSVLSVLTYNAYLEGNKNAVDFRIQAVDAFPLLGDVLGEVSGEGNRIRNLVDAGQELWPTLARHFKVPEETIRWLRGKTISEVGHAWVGRLPKLLGCLSCLPPEKRPTSPDDWTAFAGFALALDPANDNEQHTLWFKEIGKMGWVAARARFEKIHAVPSDLLDVKDLVNDVVSALFSDIYNNRPDVLTGSDTFGKIRGVVEKTFYEAGVLRQVQSSVRWHELQLHGTSDQPVESKSSWSVPYLTPQRVGGLYAHFLRSEQELKEEGLRMRHCVGSYANRCLFNETYIVSFRTDRNEPVSTANIRLTRLDDVLFFQKIDHRGYKNSAPDDVANHALHFLLKQLNKEEMKERLLELENVQLCRIAQDDMGISKEWSPERLDTLKEALKVHSGFDYLFRGALASLGGSGPH
jgi:hypothetical protein